MQTIAVTLPDASYDLAVGAGLLAGVGDVVARVAPHERVLLAVDARITATHGETAQRSLEAAGFTVTVHPLVADERVKTLGTVRQMYDTMLEARLERGSPVVAVGGGVVGDVAGFAAATYLRGVPLVQVPTTLLAMVDAAIGGRTGVNHPLPAAGSGPRTLGKNLVGAFWQPRAVVADPATLASLEPRHLRCGLAECIKHALIDDGELLAFLETAVPGVLERDETRIAEVVARCARVKIGFVESDVREAGRRALLNLGHTFAHVIEPLPELDLLHGEAVAIGLCAACAAAVATDRMSGADAVRVEALVTAAGLPTRLPRAVDPAPLVNAMAYDKKVAAGRLRLVLPVGLGRAEVVDDVPAEVITAAWRAVGAVSAPERAAE